MSSPQTFDSYLRRAIAERRLVVQPRMGFGTIEQMRSGLLSVKNNALDATPRIGTLTIDAYTRVGQVDRATEALAKGQDLNGFPIVSHGPARTADMLADIRDASFPVQVRHGSAFPLGIFQAAAAAGLDAIEGGPVSYNLPYSRAPLDRTVSAWSEAARWWAEHANRTGTPMHLESFAGCMFGQLCPPSLLIALTILECEFFLENGLESISLSLAQGTNNEQDIGALMALNHLSGRYFPDVSWHIVYYTFMGLFPRTESGARAIIRDSARIAVIGGAHRLIVKTVAEARGIPTVAENVDALRLARSAADGVLETAPGDEAKAWAGLLIDEAEALITAARARAPSVAAALVAAFADGTLDVPYCSHPNNRNASRTAVLPESGALVWARPGAMPIRSHATSLATAELNAAQFHAMLNLNRQRYDRPVEANNE